MLFQRNARVTAWRAEPERFFSQPGATNALLIVDLRIEFKIEHTAGKHANTCELTITNANESTRAFLAQKPLSIRLEAGYAGEFTQLFVGDLRYGQSTQKGTEWVTTLQIADGDRAYRHARVSESFTAGTTILETVRKCAESLQLPLPSRVVSDPALQAQWPAGRTLSGPAHEVLSKLLAPTGYTFSIQNNRLTILRESETSNELSYVVDATNGLVGSPETSAPEKSKKQPITTVTTLLDARLYPGQKIELNSKQKSGTFKITKVAHTGDTHGGDFQTKLECVPI